MRHLSIICALCVLFLVALPAWSLTPDEVIRLKKAGVSDEVIQKMLEQEKAGVATQGPMTETEDEVVYRAGSQTPEEIEENRRREREKEDKSMEVLKGVIIDTRNPSLK
ncbi:hypothetical protein [Dethiosulfatarculus sandiegensis]|uniref:Uncharacterized protein n=1 Tax=Dethiosulfatarculus sandiegensis TaxID=1429043 RepID=A0A0D2K0G2_9BACT|nr:hypothetical protein [Dethiosulfatarculus sandiegensis]KIX15230.1 hypothetical protein X474_05270 [Dethiosulfatarculus sandiegensis]